MFAPKTAFGEFIPIAGRVMISLLDPAQKGQAQRVAMWDFTAEHVAQRMVRSDKDGRGILLYLPWQTVTPKNTRLPSLCQVCQQRRSKLGNFDGSRHQHSRQDRATKTSAKVGDGYRGPFPTDACANRQQDLTSPVGSGVVQTQMIKQMRQTNQRLKRSQASLNCPQMPNRF